MNYPEPQIRLENLDTHIRYKEMVNPQYTEGVPHTNLGGRNSRHE